MLKGNVRDILARRLSIGVTGFSRSGKTVFIGALTHALLSVEAWKGRRGQGPLAGFGPFLSGKFQGAEIRSDIHDDEPQFPFSEVRDALCDDASWPSPTEGISRLVLDLAIERRSKYAWLGSVADSLEELGNGHTQLELIDYPGEWLIDLPMLQLDYAIWSKGLLSRATQGTRSRFSDAFFQKLNEKPPPEIFDEDLAAQLAAAWTNYLESAAANGFVYNQPGRLLCPDQLARSPVLRLVPLPDNWAESRFYSGMKKRFEQYKKLAIRPFYRNHFAGIDRQIVIIDLLRTLQNGEEAFNDMLDALRATLASFSYGKGGPLSWLTGARTSHVLFAVSKADHVNRGDRANLEKLLEKMIIRVDPERKMRQALKHYDYIALASIRATEDRPRKSPPFREVLIGRRRGYDDLKYWDPGGVPLDFPPDWDNLRFTFLEFEPLRHKEAREEGFPAIGLGKALDFLIGAELT